MQPPSELGFLGLIGLSTVVSLGAAFGVSHFDRPPPGAPPRMRLGPSMSAGMAGWTLLAMAVGGALTAGGAVALHQVSPDAVLWWLGLTLVPFTLIPSIFAAHRAVVAAAEGEVRLEGDTLVAVWRGETRRWHLPECTLRLRLVPAYTADADAALIVIFDGPDAPLALYVPLPGLAGIAWLQTLALPDGWSAVEHAAAFPVADTVPNARSVIDGALARVARVDRG